MNAYKEIISGGGSDTSLKVRDDERDSNYLYHPALLHRATAAVENVHNQFHSWSSYF